jgi:hypothetical protein
MAISEAEGRTPYALAVSITDDTLSVDLSDGRAISVPIAWYPRLLNGTAAERGNLQLIGAGEGIHWPDLDEDLSVEGLLAGRPSAESGQSLQRWLASRSRT